MDKPNFEHQNSDFEVKISAEDNYEVALLNNEGDPHNDDPSVQQKQNYDSMQDRNGQNSFNKTEDKKLKKLTYYPWTEQEEKLLLQLYQKHGPAWTKFVPLFHQKNETSIKNKFHRSFDKAVKTLHDHQKKVFRKLCRVTTNRTIGIILEISVQLRELILRQNFVVNPESLLFAYRNLFLKLCFMNSNFTKQQLTDLSNLGKAFNSKIKNLGVFRVKNIKSWKITESTIWTFCQIDRICLDQQTFIQKIFGNRAKKFVQMPLNVKMVGDEKQLADEQYGIDQDHNMEQDYHRHQQYATNYPHTEGTIKTEYFNNAYYYDYVPLLPMDYPYIYQYLMQNYAETRNNNIEIKQEANIETKRSDRQNIKIQQTGEIKIQFLNY